ncbi:C40 family peptidase [Bacillus sp. AFS037270]|uniref:C40 family peptidase n=1 Tax=Bacillus sp. AFS037270 TaxID=2033499 RepID=UPI000BFE80DC|nr:C40 family peptidase [Bacillus sp. AFS037270]PGV47819.1 peptidoglycan endopeptidase [Bacillus sp. AFS037270]
MKKKFIALFTATVFGTSLYSTTAMAATIKVKSGDTLSKYSKQYNIAVSEIKTANKLSSDRIYIGQNLYIPEKGKVVAKTSTSPSSVVYTVKSGDSLSLIAKRYGTTVTQLKSWNGLKSDLIRIGQKLKVTSGTVTSPVAPTPSATKPAVSSINKAKLVQDAKTVVGSPYKWGGTTSSGFDCSGFIYYVVNKQKNVSRSTVAGYWNMMKPVSTLSVGDFVYYETYKKGPSHMGIYVGNGKFIHSGSQGVQISDMNISYWKSRYLGARQF